MSPLAAPGVALLLCVTACGGSGGRPDSGGGSETSASGPSTGEASTTTPTTGSGSMSDSMTSTPTTTGPGTDGETQGPGVTGETTLDLTTGTTGGAVETTGTGGDRFRLSGDDVTALLGLAAGVVLVTLGFVVLWRSRRVDEPVADLLAAFSVWAVHELLRNDDLDVRRALVHHIVAVRADHSELAQAAIAVVRAHPDKYLRERLAYDLGESNLIPCKPHPTATE